MMTNMGAEIAALRLAVAYLLRAVRRDASIDQEVDDIIADATKQGAKPDDRVRASLTSLLMDSKYVGSKRPAAGGGDPEARKIRAL